MKFNPEIHRRRSIRLQGYDYAQAGAYFVTLCTQNRECLFGDVAGEKMLLNDAGRMIEEWYSELENKFHDVQCDEFICMPNHVHFIVVNAGADPGVRPGASPRQGKEHICSSLHQVVQWFKTMSTNTYIQGVKQHSWRPFPDKLWQRNYWEHVIRHEPELNHIREYIQHNPLQWELDALHPKSIDGSWV